MHNVETLEANDKTSAHDDFLVWVSTLLPSDKFEVFKKLFVYPIQTNSITESIFQEFPRYLEARNRYENFHFVSDELKQDFYKYLYEIGMFDFWSGEGLQALQDNIQSFIVCDLTERQTSVRPEPYVSIVPIDFVIDVDIVNYQGNLRVEYIAFCIKLRDDDIRQGNTKRVGVYDDEYYRVYVLNKAGKYDKVIESRHGLGFCPAFKFYPKVFSNNLINSKSPITEVLGDLDRYLFWAVSYEHFRLYGSYPIYWGYKQTCTYEDENGHQCDGNGWVRWVEGKDNVMKSEACPRCSTRKVNGAGTWISVTAPTIQGEFDPRDPVGKLDADTQVLKLLSDKLRADETKIVYNVTGKTFDSVTATEAVNELQVSSSYETRKIVLVNLARIMEKTMWNVYDCMARLRYNEGSYIDTTIKLGDEFYLKDIPQLMTEYKNAKSAGMPMFNLQKQRDFINQTENQHNDDENKRYLILKELEPYQDFTIQELKNLGIDVSDPDNFYLKVNFNEYINRFEREYLPITQFGNLVNFNAKINQILTILKEYSNEKRLINAGTGEEENQM